MAKQLQLRKGTAAEHDTFTGANGEVTVDTTNKTLRVHDGVTVGGIRLATLTSVVLNNTLTSTSTTEALTAAQGKVLNDQAFGVGQTWQDVTGSRSKNTTYTNTTGRSIYLKMVIADTPFQVGVALIINNIRFDYSDVQEGFRLSIDAVIPSGGTYRFEGNDTIITWAELR